MIGRARRTAKRLGYAAIVFGLASIASSAIASGVDALASIKSVGVIACLGDTAEVRQIGVTAFGNKSSELPITDWNLESRLVDDAAKVLSPRYRVEISPLPTETSADLKGLSCKLAMKRLKDVIKANPNPPVDAYLIFIKSSDSLPYPSNQAVEGAGVYRRASLFSGPGSGVVVHLTYDVTLIDAHTARQLKYQPARLDRGEPQTLSRKMVIGSMSAVQSGEAVDEDYPDNADAFRDEQKAALRRRLEELADRSVGITLSRMRLAEPP